MEKNILIEIKRRLIALGLAGIMLGTAGCASNSSKDENEVPKYTPISSKYSKVEKYYKYVIQNGEAVKQYNSKNVFLLYDKETYEVNEYLYNPEKILGGLSRETEFYDLPSETMLVYCDGISTAYNEEYFKYIVDNAYQVWLGGVSDYIEGHVDKEYYTLDEIRALESQIAESLKIINAAKEKTK